jgi:hypothetical protein
MSGATPVLFFHSVFPLATIIGWERIVHQFDLSKVFQVISVLGSALTAYKLYQARIHRRYRIFFAYLLFRIPYISCAIFLDVAGTTYLWLFTKSEPIVMLFYVLIVLELYRLVLERYKGLYTLGRWAMGVAMAIALSVSILGLGGVASAQVHKFSWWVIFEAKAEARLDLALVLFILLILLFLSRYPIRLNRNVVVHTIVYSVFFFADSLGLVLWLFKTEVPVGLDKALMGIASACAVAWWIGLTKKGEEVQVRLPSLGPGAEQRVMQQLEALNATLLKASQK